MKNNKNYTLKCEFDLPETIHQAAEKQLLIERQSWEKYIEQLILKDSEALKKHIPKNIEK